VWGGLTFAAVIGVAAFFVAQVAGWNAQLTAFRAAAVLFTVFAVPSLPGWFLSRRAGRIAPIIEPVGEVIIALALVWVAFVAGGDALHSAGWVFVAVMAFAVIEAFYGRAMFNSQKTQLGPGEADSPVAVEQGRMARSYLFTAGLEFALAAIAVFLLTRPA
jgi:hypothetical protein